MTDLITVAPIIVPTALLLWLLRDVSSLKTMMATTLQKQMDTEARMSKLEHDKHETRGHMQTLTTRVDLMEWRFQTECNKAAAARKDNDNG